MTSYRRRARFRATFSLCAAFGVFATSSVVAQECPGHSDALGTSRTLVVDPREHPRIGTMQYTEMLPLADREVVLTFDDGPLPKYSNAILDLLKAECVKATFFVVGEMARAHPEGVRRMRDEGHTVGTHSENHPLSMNRMSIDDARKQIDDGIANTAAALGEAPAPFFRIPGLLRAELVEDYLGSQGLQTWSADFPADDWHKITPERVHALAMSRLAAKGKGVILLHDIQQRTVAALPAILRDLKAGGYKIVHVVPARPDLPKTPTQPEQWRERPINPMVAIRRWPQIPRFAFADTDLLPSPALSFTAPQNVPFTLPRTRRNFETIMTGGFGSVGTGAGDALAMPDPALFAMREKTAPNYRIAVAIPRPAQIPPAQILAKAINPERGDLLGKLIAATAEPEVTGSIASATSSQRPPQGVASISMSTH